MEIIEKRKRFMVFEYSDYYPRGGLEDVEFESDDMEEAINYAKGLHRDVAYVFDRVEGILIYENP